MQARPHDLSEVPEVHICSFAWAGAGQPLEHLLHRWSRQVQHALRSSSMLTHVQQLKICGPGKCRHEICQAFTICLAVQGRPRC